MPRHVPHSTPCADRALTGRIRPQPWHCSGARRRWSHAGHRRPPAATISRRAEGLSQPTQRRRTTSFAPASRRPLTTSTTTRGTSEDPLAKASGRPPKWAARASSDGRDRAAAATTVATCARASEGAAAATALTAASRAASAAQAVHGAETRSQPERSWTPPGQGRRGGWARATSSTPAARRVRARRASAGGTGHDGRRRAAGSSRSWAHSARR